MRRILLTLFLLAHGISSHAQAVFSLRPQLGMQTPLAGIEDNSSGVGTFRINRINLNPDYGLFLEARLRERTRLSLGYTNWGVNGVQFVIRSPLPSLTNNPKAVSSVYGLAENVHRIQFRYARTLFVIPVLAGRERQLSANVPDRRISLHIEPMLGLSVDFINPSIRDGLYPSPLPLEMARDTIRDIVTNVRRINRRGISVQTGISLQLINRNRESFALSVLYTQGLVVLNRYDISYYISSSRLPGRTYQSTAASRATSFSVNFSYPVRLYADKKARQSDTPPPVPYIADPPDQVIRKRNYRRGEVLVGANGLPLASSVTAGLRLGYFVGNRLLIGLEANHSRSEQNGFFYKSVTTARGAGLIGRYYVTSGRVAPFLQAGLLWGDYEFRDVAGGRRSERYNTTYAHLLPGVSIQIWQRLKLDTGLQFVNDTQKRGKLNDLIPHVGLHYQLSSL